MARLQFEDHSSDVATAFEALRQPSATLRKAPHRDKSWRRDMVWLALILTVWFGLFLGTRPLSNPDEGRYAEIPREMAHSGDWVTPRLNGVKYFEKPPLLYWLSAGTMKVFGVNEWTARAWFALFAVIGGLATYAATRSLYGRAAGWWASIVLCTSMLYYVLAHTAILDLPVAVTISGALFLFLAGVRSEDRSRRRVLFWGFYACMGLAVLTKGLIGFLLPCTVAFVWLSVFGQWKFLRPCYPIMGAVILLAITAPWHVLAAVSNHSPTKEHDFAWFYFVHEHLLRFTTNSHARAQPWWFFGPVLIVGMIPWAAFAWQSVRENITGGWKTRTSRQNADIWFFITWVVVIGLFFSASQSKLIPYILPVFPALAVLIGKYLAQATGTALRPGVYAASAIALLLGAVAAFAPIPPKLDVSATAILPWRILLGVALGGGGIAAVVLASRGRARIALAPLIAGFCIFMLSANFVAGTFDSRSTKPLAELLNRRLAPGDEVYCMGDYFQDTPVYLRRVVNVVDSRGELGFGMDAEPSLAAVHFIDSTEFARRWQKDARAYALVEKRNADRWFGEDKHVIAQTNRYLLLANTAQGRSRTDVPAR